MKNYVLLFLLFAGMGQTFAQNCNIGNENTTGWNNGNPPFWENYLLGSSFNLPATGLLQSINVITISPTSQIQMAVYDDNGNAPGNLIASTTANTLMPGVNSFPVGPLVLNPGNYWVMAVYSAPEYSIWHNTNGNNLIYYTALTFGNPIPTTGAGFTSYNGDNFAYFLGISCITSAEDVLETTTFSVYPNPASDHVYLGCTEAGLSYVLTDLSGRTLFEGIAENELQRIELGGLSSGIYFIELKGVGKRKIVVK